MSQAHLSLPQSPSPRSDPTRFSEASSAPITLLSWEITKFANRLGPSVFVFTALSTKDSPSGSYLTFLFFLSKVNYT